MRHANKFMTVQSGIAALHSVFRESDGGLLDQAEVVARVKDGGLGGDP
jgi:hypothetical protein